MDELLELCAKHTSSNVHKNRLYNTLRRGMFCWSTFKPSYSIRTIEDLRNASLEDIARFPGMGAKSMEAVRNMKEDI